MSIRIAILLSGRHGRGSNMQALHDACVDGKVDGDIAVVVGSHADSPALSRARDLGIVTEVILSPARTASLRETETYDQMLQAALDKVKPDLICLAGYLRKLPSSIVRAWPQQIMNTHPALLPAFGGRGMYGINVHQAVLDYGVKVSGCTVHFVDEAYDSGPIILQSTVPVLDTDTAETLAARVLDAEHTAYPAAVALFAHGRLTISGRHVIVTPSASVPDSTPQK